jgi:hypothetical protein
MAGTAGMATAAAERRGPATPLRLSKPGLVGPGTLLVYKHQKLVLAKFEQAYTYTVYMERKQMNATVPCKPVRVKYTYARVTSSIILLG